MADKTMPPCPLCEMINAERVDKGLMRCNICGEESYIHEAKLLALGGAAYEAGARSPEDVRRALDLAEKAERRGFTEGVRSAMPLDPEKWKHRTAEGIADQLWMDLCRERASYLVESFRCLDVMCPVDGHQDKPSCRSCGGPLTPLYTVRPIEREEQ